MTSSAQCRTRESLPAAGIDPYDADATAPSELVCFTQAFHGRTLGALALTAKVRKHSLRDSINQPDCAAPNWLLHTAHM